MRGEINDLCPEFLSVTQTKRKYIVRKVFMTISLTPSLIGPFFFSILKILRTISKMKGRIHLVRHRLVR